MKCYMLYLGDSHKDTRTELEKQGWDVQMFEGFDNINKWSLSTNHTYELDSPGSNYHIGPTTLGISLAHWVLWRALEHFGQDDYYHIMEEDIKLRPNWRQEFDMAMENLPKDWDMIYPGSCCKNMEAHTRVRKNLYRGAPLCTHWYTVRHKALRTLIDANSSAWGPIDIQLQQMQRNHKPELNIYTILPRLADQKNTQID